MTPAELLAQRLKTHGNWVDVARVANRLKIVLHQELDIRNVELGAARTEALGMILAKIARIVSGDPNHPDHWDDIAGYAMLGKGESNA